MIRNTDELYITQNSISSFKDRLSHLININNSKAVQYEIFAIQAMLNDLNRQVEQYSKIINNEIKFNSISSINDFPLAVISNRLQLGLDESAMSDKLGLTKDEYINLERNDFYGISNELLSNILDILNLPNNLKSLSLDIIEENLKNLKVNEALLQLLPIPFEKVKQAALEHASNANYILEKFLESFKNIFSVDLTDTSKDIIDRSFSVAFKRRINTNASRLDFTTAFAAHYAWIISNQIPYISEELKADPIEIRNNILSNYTDITLEACLDYIWNLNIGVLPLNISRGFHGACFDFENKKIIALNQQNKSVSRWKFDLLHEFYHALTMDYNAYIERVDVMDQNEQEEEDASLFASYVIFGSEMNAYVKMVLEKCEGKSEYMKHSIEKVAKEYDLNLDDFSSYVAYKTSGKISNFWGVAHNLQQDKRNPYEIAKKKLLDYLDFSNLNEDEIFMLQKILMEGVAI